MTDDEPILILAGLKQELDNYHPDSVEKDCVSCDRTLMITPETQSKIEEFDSRGRKTNVVCGHCFIGVGKAG